MTNEQKYLFYLEIINLKEKYLECRKDYLENKNDKTRFTAEILELKDNSFYNFICTSFYWSATEEGLSFWLHISYNDENEINESVRYYLRNLKLNRVL